MSRRPRPSLARRRSAVHAALLALTCWPLLQIALGFALDTSPWKLAGWGMYAAPVRVPHLALMATRPGQPVPTQITEPHPSLADPIRVYMTSRADLGPLWSADDLAADVFAVYPDVLQLYLSYVETRLDRQSALIVRRPYLYAYERDPDTGAIRSVQ